MKVLLVFPTMENTPKGSPKAPLGLAYIAAYLEKFRHQVKIVDMYTHGLTLENLLEEISAFQPQLIGFAALTIYMPAVGRFAAAVKEKFPAIKIAAGHVHPSALPVETLEENQAIDFAVIGEGEETFRELAETIEKEGNLADIKGLAFREGNTVKVNASRPRIENLDELPFPAWHLLDMETYLTGLSSVRTFSVITTRGCPFQCTYCDQDKLWHRVVRVRSQENVIKELKQLKERYGLQAFIIQDDTFTINKQRVIDFCDALLEENLKLFWEAKARVNLVDLEMLRKMKEAGCGLIIYGIESGSQKILDSVRKGITLEQARNAVKWTKEAGVGTGTFWMMGFPEENEEDIKKTVELAKEIDSDFISSLAILIPFPGTPIYQEMKKEGLILNENWESYWKVFETDQPQFPVVRTKHVSAERLFELKRKYEKELAVLKRNKFLKNQLKRAPIHLVHFLKNPKRFLFRLKKTARIFKA